MLLPNIRPVLICKAMDFAYKSKTSLTMGNGNGYDIPCVCRQWNARSSWYSTCFSIYSLDSVHAIAYIAAMIIFLSILAYEKAVQHPGF